MKRTITIYHRVMAGFLTVAILTFGLPLFHPSDINRDLSVDLSDAIIQVANLVQTTQHPETFSACFNQTLQTLQRVAGLETVIQQDNDFGQSHNQIKLMFFSDSAIYLPFILICIKIAYPVISAFGISIHPPVPPPECFSI